MFVAATAMSTTLITVLLVGLALALGWGVYDCGRDTGWNEGYEAARRDLTAARQARLALREEERGAADRPG